MRIWVVEPFSIRGETRVTAFRRDGLTITETSFGVDMKGDPRAIFQELPFFCDQVSETIAGFLVRGFEQKPDSICGSPLDI